MPTKVIDRNKIGYYRELVYKTYEFHTDITADKLSDIMEDGFVEECAKAEVYIDFDADAWSESEPTDELDLRLTCESKLRLMQIALMYEL